MPLRSDVYCGALVHESLSVDAQAYPLGVPSLQSWMTLGSKGLPAIGRSAGNSASVV